MVVPCLAAITVLCPQAKMTHRILNASPLRCCGNREIAHGGDESTINVGAYDPETFVQEEGPSYRQVFDLSDIDNRGGYFVLPLGESGHIFSSMYDNMLSTWASGQYVRISFFEWAATHSQTLKPK